VTYRKSARLRIALFDEQPVVRAGLVVRLLSELELDLIGVHASSQALIEGLHAQPADIALVDYELRPKQLAGASLIRTLRAAFPAIRILVFSDHSDPVRISLAMRAGANGFVGKRQPMHELIDAIHIVALGSDYVQTASARSGLDGKSDSASFESPLSEREKDVIRCYLEGMTVTEIAQKFERSIKTISSQKASALRKLGASSNNDLFNIRDRLDTL
jgi:DNA-binding NarL/FixJ family response regulator